MDLDFDTQVRLAIYRHFAETGLGPTPGVVAGRIGTDVTKVLAAYPRLRAARVLVLDADGSSILMAPPFSGVPTEHVARVGGRDYFANCAWDAFGIPAALGQAGEVHSRCAQSGDRLDLVVGGDGDGPAPSPWLFHCLVPAARWWDDIAFT